MNNVAQKTSAASQPSSAIIEVPDSIFDAEYETLSPSPGLPPEQVGTNPSSPTTTSTVTLRPATGEAVDSEPGRRKKPTPELVYARLKRVDQNLTTEGRTTTGRISTELYHWAETHWQHQQFEEARQDAFAWLGDALPSKATPYLAKSCVMAAADTIQHDAAERTISVLEANRTGRVIVPTVGGYLEIHKDGRLQVLPPDRKLGLTFAIKTTLDPAHIHSGWYTPAEVPADSLWGNWLTTFMPDIDVRNLLQEAAAASLMPNRYERAFLLLGDGANGKSTFLTALRAIHAGSATSLSLTDIVHRFGLETIIGKTLVTVAEAPNSISDAAVQRLKAAIGRDAILIDRKFEKAVTINPRVSVYVALNRPLRTEDQTHGANRKFTYIPFQVRMSNERKDDDFAERLVNNPKELQIFLDWLLVGALRLVKRGRLPEKPEAVSAIEEQVRQEVDTVHGWVVETEAKPTTPIGDTTLWCPRDEIYALYRQATLDAGQRPVADKEFWRRMRSEFPGLQENRIRGEGGVRKYMSSIWVPGLTRNSEAAERAAQEQATEAARRAGQTPEERTKEASVREQLKAMFERGEYSIVSREAWAAGQVSNQR